MKSIISIFLLFILTTAIVSAQNIFPTNGNVGIGTVAPVGNLDVYSSSNTTISPLISLRSNFHVVGNYGMIKFGDFTQTVDYQKGAIIYESVAGSARGKLHIALENSDSPASVTLADARLTILSDGNVGIGTATPKEKLSVNGKIRSYEVKVEVTGWPDYVFKSGYQLHSLAEVEKFIKKNGHLPDVPSAITVETKGLELGEMNKLLLKKIEELTLHLIEKDKKFDRLVKKVEALEARK